jgi:adenosylhomocysteine nucleosidase
MTIGLLCAIPQERAQLEAALEASGSLTIAGMRFDRGLLDGREVVLVGAGIGKVNTALVATLLAQRFGARLIVFTGVAGGLDPDLHIGDIVIADRTIQHDAGVIEGGRLRTYQAGHVPFFNPTPELGWPVEPGLLARVRAALADLTLPPLSRRATGLERRPRIVYGPILTGDQYLSCEATRVRLFAELRGKAIEMEGGALAQVAEAFGLPWLDIRALSDLAGQTSSFDFGAFVEEVAASSAIILRRLLPVL